MTSAGQSEARGVMAWFLDHRVVVLSGYSLCLALALVETVIRAPGGGRGLAVVVTLGLLPVSAMLTLLTAGAQIAINPLWSPAVTRGFMSVLVIVAPLVMAGGLVVFPTAPGSLRSLGNTAVTGRIGVAWAAQYLYERHGLERSVSFLRLLA